MDREQGQMAAEPGEFARRVEQVLAKVRPALQADGGDIELVAVEGQNARVRLKGACHG
jgi:Fe-S cluster biogenesis protein NfuA